jgi:hypothetical protein
MKRYTRVFGYTVLLVVLVLVITVSSTAQGGVYQRLLGDDG